MAGKGRPITDRLNHRYGRLLVTAFAGIYESNNGKSRHAVWSCLCDCGNVIDVVGSMLATGNTKSCGCLQREIAAAVNTIHCGTVGGHQLRALGAWYRMHDRCSPDNRRSQRYHQRGIIVEDPRWFEFPLFLQDMGEPAEGLSLDRIDNNRGYYKENCRWATYMEQSANREVTMFVTLRTTGEPVPLTWACRSENISPSVVRARIYKGMTPEEAFYYKR